MSTRPPLTNTRACAVANGNGVRSEMSPRHFGGLQVIGTTVRTGRIPMPVDSRHMPASHITGPRSGLTENSHFPSCHPLTGKRHGFSEPRCDLPRKVSIRACSWGSRECSRSQPQRHSSRRKLPGSWNSSVGISCMTRTVSSFQSVNSEAIVTNAR